MSNLYYVVTTGIQNRLCYGEDESAVRIALGDSLAADERIVGMRPASPEDIAWVRSQRWPVPTAPDQ